LYRFGDKVYVSKDKIEKNHEIINQWKVLVPYASPGDDSYPHLILSKPIIAGTNTACTETYLVIGPFNNEKKAKNVANYMTTMFFRFMILLAKSTQHITQKNYSFVPLLDFEENWTDKKLFNKYCISSEEIEFMRTLIKPMGMKNSYGVYKARNPNTSAIRKAI
jgi:site-specific DNA-methyltransferase (adenine-specific)